MSETKPLWVVKIGSSLITDNGAGVHYDRLRSWGLDLLALREKGVQVVLVSSGAIAEGCARLGLKQRPRETHLQQAAAAVGQVGLIQAYESVFSKHGVHVAQVLLTHAELRDRQRYLNARSTIKTLLQLNLLPIVNENDTVATDEICFGDNDTLGALVTNLVEADVFVMLTDQWALYTADPSVDPNARPLRIVNADDDDLIAMASPSSSSGLGSGGMRTKVIAAKLASRSGAVTYLAHGLEPNVLVRLWSKEPIGTQFQPQCDVLPARKRWLAGHLRSKGAVTLDAGAVSKLVKEGKSLLSVGVTHVSGAFERGDSIDCLDESGKKIATGLVNYPSQDVKRLLGKPSRDIFSSLGYMAEPELIHRDNLVLT